MLSSPSNPVCQVSVVLCKGIMALTSRPLYTLTVPRIQTNHYFLTSLLQAPSFKMCSTKSPYFVSVQDFSTRTAVQEHSSVNTQRSYLVKITVSLSGLTQFVSKSGVQMVKEGDITLLSLKKLIHSQHECFFYSRPCGLAEVSDGPRLPASPSGHWGGPISSSHGKALRP